MSYTSLSVIDLLYRQISQSVLITDLKKPNGKLCKLERPLNSELEDVVINIVGGLDKEIVQQCVLNVNLYALNLKRLPPNEADKSQPDTSRLGYLLTLANTALGDGDEVWNDTGDYCFKIQQDRVFPDENNQHYVNLRVEFYLANN